MEAFKLTTLVILGIIALMLFSIKGKAQTVQIGTIVDVSLGSGSDQTVDSKELFQAIIDRYNFADLNLARDYFSILCGQNTISEVKRYRLISSNYISTSRTKRRKQIANFLIAVKTDVNKLEDEPSNQGQTNFYRTLLTIIKEFDPNSSSKHLIVYSDLCENSSATSFNRFINDPSSIMSHYDKIIDDFSKDAPLPDLSGFTIDLITPGANDFHLWVSRFWEKFLRSRGAVTVNVRASI